MRQHFRDNGLDPDAHRWIHGGIGTDEHIARVQVCVESSRQKQPGLLAKGKDAIIVVSGTAP